MHSGNTEARGYVDKLGTFSSGQAIRNTTDSVLPQRKVLKTAWNLDRSLLRWAFSAALKPQAIRCA